MCLLSAPLRGSPYVPQDSFNTYVDHHWPELQEAAKGLGSCCETRQGLEDYFRSKFNVIGGIGFGTIAVLALSSWMTVKVLTIPIIMKNMLTIINGLYCVVGAGITAMGAYLQRHEVSSITWCMVYMWPDSHAIVVYVHRSWRPVTCGWPICSSALVLSFLS